MKFEEEKWNEIDTQELCVEEERLKEECGSGRMIRQ